MGVRARALVLGYLRGHKGLDVNAFDPDNIWSIRHALIDAWIESVCAKAPIATAATDDWALYVMAAESADSRIGALKEPAPSKSMFVAVRAAVHADNLKHNAARRRMLEARG